MRRVALLCFALVGLLGGGSSIAGQPWIGGQVQAAPTWSGHWIWVDHTTGNQWVAFRKSFSLASVPASALTQIAVDSKYWLYINGTLVVFEGGLKRGPTPSDTYYDQLDIAPYLTAGSNTIAILVWHFGKSGFSHLDSGAGGLLFNSPSIALYSDTTWKALVHPGYGNDPDPVNQPNARLPESNVYYDARNAAPLQTWNQPYWYSPSFADGAWGQATDYGAAGVAPWNALVQRPTPLLRFTGLQDYTNASSFPTGVLGSQTTVSATLPSNLAITPYLQINASPGLTITIQTDHYADGGANNVRATYVTTGGVQEFESLGWMSGTSVQYTLPAGVQILALKYRESGYATTFAGGFSSSDPYFNTLWQKAARTVYLNMRDTFTDCPTRERAQWWGDEVNEQKVGYYAFDSNMYALVKKGINELLSWERPDHTLFSPIPGNYNVELPVQMLAAIWSFGTYYRYTGDSSIFTAANYTAVKNYMNLWTFDSNGLVNHRTGGWNWEDWGSNTDDRVLDNAWYYMALQTTIQMANATGNGADVTSTNGLNNANSWQQKLNSIATNFNAVLWNPSLNAYYSPSFTGDLDDRANALAVVAGLADSTKYPGIINVLNTRYYASPWMELYVLEALYMMHDPLDAQARMKSAQRYAPEVNDTTRYTLWELWQLQPSGTDDHGWASGPLYVLSAYAAGVQPTAPAYSSYQVLPQLGTFTALSATVPTLQGSIVVDLNLAGANHLTMSVESPAGTVARIGVPTAGMSNVTISANGTTVYANGSSTGNVAGLSYAGSDANYIYFTAQPGSWTFDETAAPAPTSTPSPTSTPTSTSSPTSTPTSTPIPGPTGTPTSTATPTSASKPSATAIPTSTTTPTPTAAASPTGTPQSISLPSVTAVPSATSGPGATNTPAGAATAVPASTPTAPPAATLAATPLAPLDTPLPPSSTRSPIPLADTPVAPPVNRPVPPRNTPPSVVGTATPPRPAGTATAIARVTSHRAAKLSLTIRLAQRTVRSGYVLPVTIATAPRARVSVTLQVAKTTVTTRGTDKHRKRILRRRVLYQTTTQGTADRHGWFTARLRIRYRVTRPVQASLTVAIRTAHGAATRTTAVIVQPR